MFLALLDRGRSVSKLSAFTYSLLTRSFQAFLPASKPCAVTHGVHHPSYLMKNATLFFRWTRCLNAPLPSKKGNGFGHSVYMQNLPWHWGTKIKGIGWAQKTGKMLPMATKVTNRPGAMIKLSEITYTSIKHIMCYPVVWSIVKLLKWNYRYVLGSSRNPYSLFKPLSITPRET